VKFLANTGVMPGTSQLVEGQVGSGVVYGLVGFLGRTLLGPMGFIAVGLDSYSKSAAGKHLWELFGSDSAGDAETGAKKTKPTPP
ncbi:MAG: DUF6072 family protein, partial [Gammaproteobacteria bacterium]